MKLIDVSANKMKKKRQLEQVAEKIELLLPELEEQQALAESIHEVLLDRELETAKLAAALGWIQCSVRRYVVKRLKLSRAECSRLSLVVQQLQARQQKLEEEKQSLELQIKTKSGWR